MYLHEDNIKVEDSDVLACYKVALGELLLVF